MTALTWVGVALLGGVAAILRFVVDGAIASRSRRDFPLGTLAVNLSGTAALGLAVGLALDGSAFVLVETATLGSYTTFSTWMLESHRLGEEGEGRNAVANVVVSLAVGLGAAALGRYVGARL